MLSSLASKLPALSKAPSPTEDFQIIEKEAPKAQSTVQTSSTSWFGSKKVTEKKSTDSSITNRPATEAPPTPPRKLTGSPETAKKLLEEASTEPKVKIFANWFGSSDKPEASAPASPAAKKEVKPTAAQAEPSTPSTMQAKTAAATGGGILGFFTSSGTAVEAPKTEAKAAEPAASTSSTVATAQKTSTSWYRWGSSTPPAEEIPVVKVEEQPKEKTVDKPKSWNWTQTFTLGLYGAEVETPAPVTVATPPSGGEVAVPAVKASLARRTGQAFVRAIKFLNPLNAVYLAKSLFKREGGSAEGSTRKWFVLKWPAISIRDNRVTNFLVDNRVTKFLVDNRVTNSLKAILTACTYANAKAAAGTAGAYIATKGRLLYTGTCALLMGAYRLLCKLPIPNFRKKPTQELFEDPSKPKDAAETVAVSRKQAFLQGAGAGALWLAKGIIALPPRCVELFKKPIPIGVIVTGVFAAAVGHAIKEHNA